MELELTEHRVLSPILLYSPHGGGFGQRKEVHSLHGEGGRILRMVILPHVDRYLVEPTMPPALTNTQAPKVAAATEASSRAALRECGSDCECNRPDV